jgi:predicted amidophosphoribosyltransferase
VRFDVRALLAGLLAGSTCAGCAAPGAALCRVCRPHPAERERFRTGELEVVSLARYEGALRTAIVAYKSGRRELAPVLGRLLRAAFPPGGFGADLVAPVPSTPARLRERGFAHTELLAREYAAGTAARVAPVLSQADGLPQRGRARGERLRVAGRFGAGGESVLAGRRVVLLDDVVTTGASLRGCAGALRRAGAQVVGALTLARTLRRGGENFEDGGGFT